jgi:beta-1,4-mannosyltransferase
VLSLLTKALFQLLTLLWMLLFSLPRPDTILLQLPPALPTMLVCRLAAVRHGARLVFDWHNFAHTLMALGMGPGHPVVSHTAAVVQLQHIASSQLPHCGTL